MVLFGELVDDPDTQIFKRAKIYLPRADFDSETLQYMLKRKKSQSIKHHLSIFWPMMIQNIE
jgi:hypothetical protein